MVSQTQVEQLPLMAATPELLFIGAGAVQTTGDRADAAGRRNAISTMAAGRRRQLHTGRRSTLTRLEHSRRHSVAGRHSGI